mgnify:FL=1
MLFIYRFRRGFLRIEIRGDIAEALLNICAKNGIPLWSIRRRGSVIRSFISVSDFRRLPALVAGSGLRVHILARYGLPFFTERYKERLGIPVGAALFFAFLSFMSGFVWSVGVEGNSAISKNELLAECRDLGIYEGMRKSDISPAGAKLQLLLRDNRLSWCAFNIEGCYLTVDVTEAKRKEEDNSVPTNLKAAADGIIKRIDVTSGNCIVKVGDTVAKGDILVSGIEERADGTKFVHSAGRVTAVIEREITVTAKYKQKTAVLTGKKKTKRVLSVFGLKIPLYLGSESKPYRASTHKKVLKLFGRELPAALYEKRFEFTEETEKNFDRTSLEAELERLFSEQVKLEISGVFSVKNREIDEIKGGLRLKTAVLAEENIATQDIMLFNTGNS